MSSAAVGDTGDEGDVESLLVMADNGEEAQERPQFYPLVHDGVGICFGGGGD